MKTIVTAPADKKYQHFELDLDTFRNTNDISEFILCDDNPDNLVRKYAEKYNITINTSLVENDTINIEKAIDCADYLIAFWNGESNYVENLIDLMRISRKPYMIVTYNED